MADKSGSQYTFNAANFNTMIPVILSQIMAFQSIDEDDTLLSDFFSDPNFDCEFLSEDNGYFSLRGSFKDSLKDNLKEENLNSSLNGLDSIRDTSLKENSDLAQIGMTDFHFC